MFQERQWPEGFEFPACGSCNEGTRRHDLLVSLLARFDPFTGRGDADGKVAGYFARVEKTYPGLLGRMMPTPSEARANNRKLGISPAPGQSHQEAGGVKLPHEFHEAVCALSRKLAKAIYYREARSVFPSDGCLLLKWFTNVELLKASDYEIFQMLKGFASKAPPVVRSGRHLNDQFEYKVSLSSPPQVLMLQARFGKSFGTLTMGSTQRGQIEEMLKLGETETGMKQPYTILQSVVA